MRTDELDRLDEEIRKASRGPAETYVDVLKSAVAVCEGDAAAAEYLDLLELHSELADTYDRLDMVEGALRSQVQEALRHAWHPGFRVRTTRLRVTMRHVEPRVERVIDVPAAISLDELHEVLQVAIGRTDSHLHQFRTDDAVYTIPFEEFHDDDEVDERRVRLSALPNKFVYAYDLGDNWQHDVEVLGRGDDQPGCVYGEGACPPEDCGGGYADLLDALADLL